MKTLKRITLLLLSVILFITFIPSPEVLAAKKTKKTYMTSRFKRLEKKTNKLYDDAFTQYDMNVASMEECTIWQKELNKVYKKELKRISKKKAAKLAKQMKKWEKGMIKYAKKQSADCIGGTIYPLMYNTAQTAYIMKKIKKINKVYGDVGNF